ncbi:MAG: glycosyltransferase [Sedimentisphaerales bacterium]|nr:glycosyltransferase [Sedimentisphaerales bacterium]
MTKQKEHPILSVDETPYREISSPSVLSKTPLVSVKMITYNHEPFIAKAIEGVLQQETAFPYELIIGEDCSTDGTRKIVFDYQKKHPDTIRIITSDKNVGAQRNGLRTKDACRGKYIAYCEGDDYWHNPQKLHKQIEFLENYPEYGLVHSDVHVFNWETQKTIMNYNRSLNRQHNDKACLFSELLKGNYRIFTCSVCVRNDLLSQVLASDPYIYHDNRFPLGDWPRWLELSRVTKFKYFEDSFATYTVQPNSATHTKNYSKKLTFAMASLELTLYIIRKYNPPKDVVDTYLNVMIPDVLALAYKAGNKTIAKQIKCDYPNYVKGHTRLYYLGTQYRCFYYLFEACAYIKRILLPR